MGRNETDSSIRLTAELLAEAYDANGEWLAEILRATYSPPKDLKVPVIETAANEPIHPSTLDTHFRPSVYAALRSLEVADVVDLFSDSKSVSQLAELEVTFAELQRRVPLTSFREVSEMIKPYLRHLHYARAGLRYTGTPTSRFNDCPTLDRYFTNFFEPQSESKSSDYELSGYQSQYAKTYYEFFEQRGEPVFHALDKDSNIRRSSSHREMIPAHPNAHPNAPAILIPDFAVLQKKRRGTVMSIFGLKVLRDIEDSEFDEKSKVSFVEKFVLFREFNRRDKNIRQQIKVRSAINDFIRDCLPDFKIALVSTGMNSLRAKLARRLLDSDLAKCLAWVDGTDFSVWDFPYGLEADDIYLTDKRLNKVFEFARLIDLDSDAKIGERDGVIRAIQRCLFSVTESDRFEVTNEKGFIPLSLFEAIRETVSLDPIANACDIFERHKSLFISETPSITLNFLRSLRARKSTATYSFEDNFLIYRHHGRGIEIKFGPRTRHAVEILMVGKHFDFDSSKKASEIVQALFPDPKNQKGKVSDQYKRLSSRYSWRLDSDVFGSNHPAIKCGLIRMGSKFVHSESGLKEHTFFINPELKTVEAPKKIRVPTIDRWLKTKGRKIKTDTEFNRSRKKKQNQ